jgi:hypothetical protein
LLNLMPSFRFRAALAWLTAILLAGPLAPALRAQAAGAGRVQGSVRLEGERTPVAYALVRLSLEGGGAPVRSALTDEQGAFQFAAVLPGRYRISLERIGLRSEASEVFSVAAGETVERSLVSRPQAVSIPGITATPECRTRTDLTANPRLAALWEEARKGIETTRAFREAYAYAFEQRQYWSPDRDDAPVDSLISRVINDPRRPPPNRDRRGWGEMSIGRIHLGVPDDREIIDPAFLQTHCLEGTADVSEDAFELSFRPVRPRRGRVDIRGTVHVERSTLQIQKIELEYMDGPDPFMDATIEYVDAIVPGGTLRMQAGVRFRAYPPRSALVGPVRGQVIFTNYSGLVRVDSIRH